VTIPGTWRAPRGMAAVYSAAAIAGEVLAVRPVLAVGSAEPTTTAAAAAIAGP